MTSPSSRDALPLIDEHTVVIPAPVDEVWPSLLDTVDRPGSRPLTLYTSLIGCEATTASGPRPLAEGATIPGFRVAVAIPQQELTLEGRHRFSNYALTYRLEPHGRGSSRLRAESRADFPGLGGRAYRLLIVGTRMHVVAVRRILNAVRRRSERDETGR